MEPETSGEPRRRTREDESEAPKSKRVRRDQRHQVAGRQLRLDPAAVGAAVAGLQSPPVTVSCNTMYYIDCIKSCT